MKDIKWSDLVLIFLGAFVLCSLAFYNQYPFVYPDTGAYIDSGFTGKPPIDRPILYGIFIRHVSMYESLWFVVLIQGFIVSFIIFGFICDFISEKKVVTVFLISIFTLTLFSGIGVFTGEIIPDIFAPVSLLCLLSLLFAKLKNSRKIFLSIVYVFSLSVHLSHAYIHGIVIIILLLPPAFYYIVKKKQVFIPFRKILFTGLLVVSSFILVPSVHYACGGKFQSQNFSEPFFINRLISFGIMKEYLNEKCETKNYVLCKYKDILPWDFIWSSESPMNLEGGLEKNKAEYDVIIKDILTTPKYLKKYLIKTIESSFKLFFSFDIGDSIDIQREDSSPYNNIARRFGHQEREYLGSLQNKGILDFKTQNHYQKILVYFSFFIAALIFYHKKISTSISTISKQLILVTILFLFINALLCGTISMIAPRFQCRLIWVFPLIIILIVSAHSETIISSIKRLFLRKEG